MVKYIALESSKIAIEDIQPTRWGDDDYPEEYADMNVIRITSTGPMKIAPTPRVDPLIITSPGPVPYSSDKAIPWNYGVEVYYHGVKQEPLAIKDKNVEA